MMETHDMDALIELARQCGEGLDFHVEEFAREMHVEGTSQSLQGIGEEEHDHSGDSAEEENGGEETSPRES
jgi:stringent starvation protein B